MRLSAAIENLAYDLDSNSDRTPLQTTLMYEYIPTKWITDNVCSWPKVYLGVDHSVGTRFYGLASSPFEGR